MPAPAPQIVFSEGWWVGTPEENPEERRLPEPDWLAQPQLHEKYDFSSRGEARLCAAKARPWLSSAQCTVLSQRLLRQKHGFSSRGEAGLQHGMGPAAE